MIAYRPDREWTGPGTYVQLAAPEDGRPGDWPQWYAYDGVHASWCDSLEEAREYSRRRSLQKEDP